MRFDDIDGDGDDGSCGLSVVPAFSSSLGRIGAVDSLWYAFVGLPRLTGPLGSWSSLPWSGPYSPVDYGWF